MPSQQPVAELGLPLDQLPVIPSGRFQQPPADELILHEPDPEPKAVNGVGGSKTQLVRLRHLFAGPALPGQVPHHLRIGVQFDLQLEMLVGQRDEPDAVGVQRVWFTRPSSPGPTTAFSGRTADDIGVNSCFTLQTFVNDSSANRLRSPGDQPRRGAKGRRS